MERPTTPRPASLDLNNDIPDVPRQPEITRLRIADLRDNIEVRHPDSGPTGDCRDPVSGLRSILERDHGLLPIEATALADLRHEITSTREHIARLTKELNQIQQSAGWALVQKTRKLRARLLPQGTARARAFTASMRVLKSIVSGGVTGGYRSLTRRVARALGGRAEGSIDLAEATVSSIHPRASTGSMCLDDLPWRYPPGWNTRVKGTRGHFQVLVIEPESGDAPRQADLGRLIEHLGENPDFDCRVIVDRACPASERFVSLVPSLEIRSLEGPDCSRAQAIGWLASLVEQNPRRLVTVCPTSADPTFFSEWATRGVSILGWIDDANRGQNSNNRDIALGRAAARLIVVDSDPRTPDLMATRFAVERSRIDVLRPETGENIDDAVDTDRHWTGTLLKILKDAYAYYPSKNMKVSVLVPNYNHEKYLEERLNSIFKQTRLPDEIIFLDDFSTDESVSVARRMAAMSPVPFQIVLNDRNSGSTFRQWMKGLNLANGDLIWVAESDDTCRAEYLEIMIPEFFDENVSLAYSQSAVIGPSGELIASDYLAVSDDVSYLHWRSRYSVPGEAEVEVALSQRNTIPNASAVMFRKPGRLDYADALVKLKLAGDWLFYAMQIRMGKIAFVPLPLNSHRHHPKTVRNAFERGFRMFEEQLEVKSRILESFPVSSHAISRSLGRTIQDFNAYSKTLAINGPSLTTHPAFASYLGRIKRVLRDRLAAPDRLRVLIVVDSMEGLTHQLAAIRLANALADHHQVYLCNARPRLPFLGVASMLDDRIVLIEGSLGSAPWSFGGNSNRGGTTFGDVPGDRAEVLEELIRFHAIDILHSHGWWADRLVYTVNRTLGVCWFIDIRGDSPGYRQETERDPKFKSLIGPMLGCARGVFYSADDDLSVFSSHSIKRPACVTQIFDMVDERSIGIETDQAVSRDIREFLVVLAASDHTNPEYTEADAWHAVRSVNALPVHKRGGRVVRLVTARPASSFRRVSQAYRHEVGVVSHEVHAEFCDVARQCDAAIFVAREITRASTLNMIECMASGTPVLAYDVATSPGLTLGDGYEAGLIVPTGLNDLPAADGLATAILRYLNEPELHAAHRSGARAIFEQRFRSERTVARVVDAYHYSFMSEQRLLAI